jgi:hypothetical protein
MLKSGVVWEIALCRHVNGYRRFESTTILRNIRKYSQHSTVFNYIAEDDSLQIHYLTSGFTHLHAAVYHSKCIHIYEQ